jgi:hypothetical protein
MGKATSRTHGLLEILQLMPVIHAGTKVPTAIRHPALLREGTAYSETRHSSHITSHLLIKARPLDADRLDGIEMTGVVKYPRQPGSTLLWGERRPRSLQSGARMHFQ